MFFLFAISIAPPLLHPLHTMISTISEAQRQRMEANRAAALARLQTKSSAGPQSFHSVVIHTSVSRMHNTDDCSFTHLAPLHSHTRAAQECQSIQRQETHNYSSSSSTNTSAFHLPLSYKDYVREAEKRHPSSKRLRTSADTNSVSGPSFSDLKAPARKMDVSLELLSFDRFTVQISDLDSSQDFLGHLFNSVSPLSGENSERSIVYHIKDYQCILDILRSTAGVVLDPLPQKTLFAVRKMLQVNYSHGRWTPFMPIHVADTVADELMQHIPHKLKSVLLPFQIEGVKYGLRRGGRCLIADEMGVGKTIQAIALAACYAKEGSILITCPASLRLMWAEELERWLPFLLPNDIHLVFGRRDNLTEDVLTPRVVVISYTMLRRLRSTMMRHKWAMLIVDESHNLRCTKNKVECEETTTVLDIAKNIRRILLLSGTPSLSRPYDIFHQINMLSPCLLGKNKYEFAQNYCFTELSQANQIVWNKDFSKGRRLHELNILLKETVMIRRLKDDVLAQLPPKRRQVIRLTLEASDIQNAKAYTTEGSPVEGNPETCFCGLSAKGCCDCDLEDANDDSCDASLECRDEKGKSKKSHVPFTLSYQEVGLAKLRGIREWLSNHPSLLNIEKECSSYEVPKMIIFAHHLKVLDSIQEMVHCKGLDYVRIDGSTMAADRQKAVNDFRCNDKVTIAIIGLTAGGVGLNFSSAQSVVFAELPKSTSDLLQAEDRAHRYGQRNAVNIYFFCAKDTIDEIQWQSLSKSTERVTTMTNGSDNAVTEIKVDAVLNVPKANYFEEEASLKTFNQDDDMWIGKSAVPCQAGTFQVALSSGISYGSGETIQSSNNLKSPVDLEEKHLPFNEKPIISPDSLLFEVSANTGRIHLYRRSESDGYRPTPLEENFLPECLDFAKEFSGIKDCTDIPPCLKENRDNWNLAISFIQEWNSLRPVDRNCLFRRPLQTPLALELDCIKAEGSYVEGGLVKGGSKRRVLHVSELDANIPEGATWKVIALRQRSSKESKVQQAWTTAGEPLCKFCFHPCSTFNAKEPRYFEDLFCHKECYQNYRIKTSQSYLRKELFLLEKGVCSICKLDCHALVEKIRPLRLEKRKEYVLQKASEFKNHKRLLERLVSDPKEGNAWHADHIVAVFQGGGECNLRNMRTLCVICHAKVTAEQCCKRRKSFMKAKQGFQITMDKFIERWCEKRMQEFTVEGGNMNLSVEPESSEDETDILGIEITGSVYSRNNQS